MASRLLVYIPVPIDLHGSVEWHKMALGLKRESVLKMCIPRSISITARSGPIL